MQYLVEISSKAEKDFKKLSKETQRKVYRSMAGLSQNPKPHGVKKIQGEDDLYRIREGDYRIIYKIQNKKLIVLVIKIGHRNAVYRGIG